MGACNALLGADEVVAATVLAVVPPEPEPDDCELPPPHALSAKVQKSDSTMSRRRENWRPVNGDSE